MEATSNKKALAINQEGKHYGVFAEIGAGQEVARQFFIAGLASKTIAKTMSAYDMTFSDEIYGKGQRYVSEERLSRMLDHEYELLISRLKKQRGDLNSFFVFADTVATGSAGGNSHGWMGVRFQTKPNGPSNDIYIHVELLDKNRLQQQHALGVLGLNLIYSCFYHLNNPKMFIQSLIDDIGLRRVQIDMIRVQGPDTTHLDNRLMALNLIENKLTRAVVFNQEGKVVLPSDYFWKKPVLVQRGAFRPVTSVNLTILERALEQFKRYSKGEEDKPLGILEITMNNLLESGKLDEKDFLDRIDVITALGHTAMISDFTFFFELKEFLRQRTDHFVSMVIGASTLDKLFDPAFYNELRGGSLYAFGRLFDDKTQILVFPYKAKDTCLMASNFQPSSPKLKHLFQHLRANELIADVMGCDDIDTSIHSSDVRRMMEKKDPNWEKWVPKAVRQVIQKNKLFGYTE